MRSSRGSSRGSWSRARTASTAWSARSAWPPKVSASAMQRVGDLRLGVVPQPAVLGQRRLQEAAALLHPSGVHRRPPEQRGGGGHARVVARAAPHLARLQQRLLGRRQAPLSEQHLADVAVAERRVDHVAGPGARVAGAAVEDDGVLPAALVEGVGAEVVEHGGLVVEVAEALVDLQRAAGVRWPPPARPASCSAQSRTKQACATGRSAPAASPSSMAVRHSTHGLLAAALALAGRWPAPPAARRGRRRRAAPSAPSSDADAPLRAAHRAHRVSRAVGQLRLAVQDLGLADRIVAQKRARAPEGLQRRVGLARAHVRLAEVDPGGGELAPRRCRPGRRRRARAGRGGPRRRRRSCRARGRRPRGRRSRRGRGRRRAGSAARGSPPARPPPRPAPARAARRRWRAAAGGCGRAARRRPRRARRRGGSAASRRRRRRRRRRGASRCARPPARRPPGRRRPCAGGSSSRARRRGAGARGPRRTRRSMRAVAAASMLSGSVSPAAAPLSSRSSRNCGLPADRSAARAWTCGGTGASSVAASASASVCAGSSAGGRRESACGTSGAAKPAGTSRRVVITSHGRPGSASTSDPQEVGRGGVHVVGLLELEQGRPGERRGQQLQDGVVQRGAAELLAQARHLGRRGHAQPERDGEQREPLAPARARAPRPPPAGGRGRSRRRRPSRGRAAATSSSRQTL